MLFAVVWLAATLPLERGAAATVRVVSTPGDVAGCAFVTDLSIQIGNPNSNKFDRARSLNADLADAQRALRSRAASTGADTVLVTSPGLIVRAKAYRCGSSR